MGSDTGERLRGRRYEDLAAAHLAALGWTILDRNYRHGPREIDIVARQARIVAFVEVKGRRSADYGHPLEAIGPGKRRDVAIAAAGWIRRRGRPGLVYRFDAVAIHMRSDEEVIIEHVPDAWRLQR